MNENTVNNITEENTIQTENTSTSTDISVEEKQSTTNALFSDDNIALAYDYYDQYYEKMLTNSNTIIANQETIINNQYDIGKQNDTVITGINVIIFLVVLYVIYQLLRNMIIVK